MNLKQLKYVLVLAQEGTFSRAAEVLNISQPSLSQYIKNIEKQVGMPLFDRANGQVRLTDAGRVYIDAGKKILDLEHQMESQFSDLAAYRSGTVSIGISPYRSVHMIPDVLKAFDALYPNIKLVIKERSGRDLIEAAERGEFDLCVIALPVDDRLFAVAHVCREEVLIAVNRDTPLYSKLAANAEAVDGKMFPAVDLRAVKDQPFAMLDQYMPMRTVTDELLRRNRITVREKIELSSNEALLSIVDSGTCASFVPSGLTNRGRPGTAFFSIKQEAVLRDVGVIYRKQQYISKPIQDLIDIFKAF